MQSLNLIACLLTPVYQGNIFANFFEKTDAKLDYSARKITFSTCNKDIQAFLTR